MASTAGGPVSPFCSTKEDANGFLAPSLAENEYERLRMLWQVHLRKTSLA